MPPVQLHYAKSNNNNKAPGISHLMLNPSEEAMYKRIREEAYAHGIGRTPILEIPLKEGVNAYAKLEYFNRFKSVKDRAAFFMLKKAQYEGSIKDEGIVVEGTSGNTGIAIASIARELGITAEIIIPPGASEGTKTQLRETGAILVEAPHDGTPASMTTTGNAIQEARRKAAENPEAYFNLFQHGNIANTMAHYYTTGPEVEEAIGKVPQFAAIGLGTGGTVTGLSKYLKSRNPNARIYAVQSHEDSFIQGIRNYAKAKERKLIDDQLDLIDGFITVTEEEAYREVQYLLKNHQVFVGTSAGANLAGARKLAENIDGGDILTVFPDSAEKYRKVYLEKGVFTSEEYDRHTAFYQYIPESAITLV